MKVSRIQKISLGLFMLGCPAIIVAGFLMLSQSGTWRPKDHYQIFFKDSISGLDKGAIVRMKGVPVGRVWGVSLVDEGARVRVELALAKDTAVLKDTVAHVAGLGIAGLKYIELSPRGEDKSLLKPNLQSSTIRTGPSPLGILQERVLSAATNADRALDNLAQLTRAANRQRLLRLISSLTRLSEDLRGFTGGNKKRAAKVLKKAERALSAIDGVGSIAGSVSSAAEKVVKSLGEAALFFGKEISGLWVGVGESLGLRVPSRGAKSGN